MEIASIVYVWQWFHASFGGRRMRFGFYQGEFASCWLGRATASPWARAARAGCPAAAPGATEKPQSDFQDA